MIETDENVKGSTTRGDVKDALKQIFTATSFILILLAHRRSIS